MRNGWVGLIAMCLLLGACSPGSSPFLRDCEKAIGERLLAPSTYKRVSAVETEEVLTLDGWRAVADPKIAMPEAAVKSNIDAGKPPKGLMARIEYDAANGYGVPIRKTAICTFVADTDGGYNERWAWAVEINGKTNLQWMVTDGLQR